MPLTSPTNCPHCGADDIVRGVEVAQTADGGQVGLHYVRGFLRIGVAPFQADFCRGCGTVVRLYVRETNKNWIKG